MSKIVLITGAGSGIGAATARRLAKDSHHVVLGARRVNRLKELADEINNADYHELDVTSLDSVQAFVAKAHEQHGRVDPTAAIYCATKYAVRALSEGLRQESQNIRVTVVSPGYTRTELADHGADQDIRAAVRAATDQIGLPAEAVADAIAYAIAQPGTVDVNEILMRPTSQG